MASRTLVPDPADPGRDLARDAIVRVLREPDMVDKVWEESRTPAVYVTCFCQVDDLLSQWRGYGAGGGYSIEFDTRMLRGMYELRGRMGEEPVIMYPTIEVHRVKYGLGDAQVRAAADKILCSPPGVLMWMETLKQLSLFKSDAFSEEREWRMSWVEAATDDVVAKFRVGDKGIIVPYVVALGIPEMAMVDAPIRSVRVGPGPDIGLRVQSVAQLLAQRGFGNVPVLPSAASFRG